MGRGVINRIGLLDEPLVAPGVGDGLVPATGGIGRVAASDEDGVRAVGRDRSHRRRRVNRRSGVVGPTADLRSVAQVVRVDQSGAVADDRRRLSVEVGDVGGGERDGVCGVVERSAPGEVRGEPGRMRDLGGLCDGCRLQCGGQDEGGGASHHGCRVGEPPCTTFHVTPLASGPATADSRSARRRWPGSLDRRAPGHEECDAPLPRPSARRDEVLNSLATGATVTPASVVPVASALRVGYAGPAAGLRAGCKGGGASTMGMKPSWGTRRLPCPQ